MRFDLCLLNNFLFFTSNFRVIGIFEVEIDVVKAPWIPFMK